MHFLPLLVFITIEYFTSTILDVIPGVTNDHVTIPANTITILIPTCSKTIVPDSNGYVPPGTCGALYDYYPSFAAAIVFSLLFGALTIAHIWLAAKWKAGYLWVLIMGVLWSTLGFTTRAISTKHQQSSGLALTSTLFTLLAPLWFNAHAYITFSHLLHSFHPSRRILNLSPRVLSTLFVSLDIGTFAIQIVGGSWASPASPPSEQKKGIDIYMGGIGIQQFFIVIFVFLTVKFQLEMSQFVKIGKVENWNRGKSLLWAIYACVGFITIRILFRLVQFNAGTSSANALVGQEAYFYALEAVPMLLAALVFIVIHPGNIVERDVEGVGSLVKEFCCCCKGRRRGGGKGMINQEAERVNISHRARRQNNDQNQA
ncbi:RTA1 like protein-domain-containing protein [Tricladium varicosporioides]|nr:RTA1 like protein-domain-containing protein [Hymenoscyphus varicosporioides]